MGLDTDAAAIVIAQSDLPGAAGEEQARALEAACEQAGAPDTYRSDDRGGGRGPLLAPAGWRCRRSSRCGDILIDDVAVPRGRVGDARRGHHRDRRAQRRRGRRPSAHAGDGNLHPTFVVPRGDAAGGTRARTAFDEMLDLAVSPSAAPSPVSTGSVRSSAPRWPRSCDPVAVELHRALKSALDPTGILNPGKALPLG